MSFFKPYNGTTHKGLMRLESLIWTLIYGGLLILLVGIFMGRAQEGSGDWLIALGVVLAAIGTGLIYLRSRLREDH